MSRHDDELEGPGPSVKGEVIGSLVALAGICALLANYWDAYGFLAPTTPQPRHIIAYWMVALSMAVGVAWTFMSAERRQAPVITYVWHALVAIVSVVALFSFIPIEFEEDEPLPVENNVEYDPCYSGGDPCG